MPFALTAFLTLLLCLTGGHFGPIGGEILGFSTLFLLTGLAMVLAFLLLPKGWTPRRQITVILLLALACRLLLLPHPVSDDLNRYLWEGRVLLEGINPYTVAPNDPGLTEFRDELVYPGINHKDLTACYPPLMILLFTGVAWFKGSFLFLKGLMTGADLIALLALLAFLRNRNLPVRNALLYALNPIILYSLAGQGHLDAFHLAFLCLALWTWDRKRPVLLFLFLGFAIQSKYIAVLAIPFVLTRSNWRQAWAGCLAVLVPLIPFLWLSGGRVFQSLHTFGSQMAYGGGIHRLLLTLTGELKTATTLCAGLFTLTILYLLRCKLQGRLSPLTAIQATFVALLLFAPTVHFWYLTWVLPFLVLTPRIPEMLLIFSAIGCFVVLHHFHYDGLWLLPGWAYALTWIPYALSLLLGWWVKRRREAHFPDSTSLSVIIPALNEEDRIAATVLSAVEEGADEVIVVDGGSDDGTRSVARNAGAMVIQHAASPQCGGGRGGQIEAGLKKASGEIAVLLHADTELVADSLAQIRSALTENGDVIGGAAGSVFQPESGLTQVIEFFNDLRAALFGVSFGDQVQFFRRTAVLDGPGYPALPLMEDVELSLRLLQTGKTVFLWQQNRVSPRRWQTEQGGRIFTVLSLVGRYLLTRPFRQPDARAMYAQYYDESD
ncbi:MAG: glycosyltransferase [Planctomycetota bacterium]|jgi:hypothetical protein